MSRFNLEDYEPVEDRLARFWVDCPSGRVATDLVNAADGQWIVRAAIYRDADDTHPWATGYAEERTSDRGVNATSALENCETSAIGRALANAGYSTKGKRPSREEMAKAARGPVKPALPPAPPEVVAELHDALTAADTLEALDRARQGVAQALGSFTISQDELASLAALRDSRARDLGAPTRYSAGDPPALMSLS